MDWYNHQRDCGGAIAICQKASCRLSTDMPYKSKTLEQLNVLLEITSFGMN
jgi:hypothetical protein